MARWLAFSMGSLLKVGINMKSIILMLLRHASSPPLHFAVSFLLCILGAVLGFFLVATYTVEATESCPDGQIWSGNRCTTEKERSCSAGRVYVASRGCVLKKSNTCPSGYEMIGGRCQRANRSCGVGQVWRNNGCQDRDERSCSAGFEMINGSCRRILEDRTCPTNYEWSTRRNRCIREDSDTDDVGVASGNGDVGGSLGNPASNSTPRSTTTPVPTDCITPENMQAIRNGATGIYYRPGMPICTTTPSAVNEGDGGSLGNPTPRSSTTPAPTDCITSENMQALRDGATGIYYRPGMPICTPTPNAATNPSTTATATPVIQRIDSVSSGISNGISRDNSQIDVTNVTITRPYKTYSVNGVPTWYLMHGIRRIRIVAVWKSDSGKDGPQVTKRLYNVTNPRQASQNVCKRTAFTESEYQYTLTANNLELDAAPKNDKGVWHIQIIVVWKTVPSGKCSNSPVIPTSRETHGTTRQKVMEVTP